MTVLSITDRKAMNDPQYEFRKSLWSPEFGTIFAGQTLKIVRCYILDSSTRLLLQDDSDRVAVFEIVGTYLKAEAKYLLLIVPKTICPTEDTTVSVVEVLTSETCRLPDEGELEEIIQSIDLEKHLEKSDCKQTQNDLKKIGFSIAATIEDLSFEPNELEKMGFYLNPYGHIGTFAALKYEAKRIWMESGSAHVLLTPIATADDLGTIELMLKRVTAFGKDKYCIFTQTAVDRAEDCRPFAVVLKQVSINEFTGISSIEAAIVGGAIVVAFHDGLAPSDQEIEACFGQVDPDAPPRV
jgi:hypothetical protein